MKNAYLRIFGEKSRTISLGEFVTLGTDDQCQIRLQGEGISERHARIEKKDGDVYLLKDLRSESGTYLNDTRVFEAALSEGSVVHIGDRDLLFTHEDSETATFALTSRNEVWHQELQALGNVAKTNFPVLILGPSGTGKDVIAHALHEASARKAGPFVSVNCSAL